jgi:serine/threonine-protein kinase
VPALPWPDTGPGDLAPSRPRRGGAHSGPASSRRRPGGPEDLILPPARIQQADHGGTNHTLIVSAGHLTDDGHQGPDRRWSRRARGYRGPGEPMLQRLLFSRRFIYLSGGLAVLLAIILVTWWLTAGQYTTVPAVRGMAVSVARTELANLGFVVKTGPGQHSSTVAKGAVVQTKPAIGSKPRQGSTVQLIVSLGPLRFPVPQVTGMKLADAEAALRKAGLKPGRVSATTSQTIANGIVISTNPVAGVSWPQTAPVAITVSDGQPLQDFVGQQLQAAESAATSAGYALNPVADKQSTQPAGTITSQSPAPGTPVSPNEVVTVHYSNGPPMTDIPNVQGMNENQATAKLTAAGFNVTVNTLGPGHRVVSYSPTGQAPEGSTITLNVGFLFNLVP